MNEHECVALVRQAVEWQDAHLGAIHASPCPRCDGEGEVCSECGLHFYRGGMTGGCTGDLSRAVPCPKCGGSGKARPTRLPDADWRGWYERARAALDALE